MPIPPELRDLAARRAEGLPFAVLQAAAQAMSETYRDQRGTAQIRVRPEERVAAYLLTRAPATYAVAHRVLQEVAARVNHEIHSVLDAGAGSGAATLAAHRVWNTITQATLIERDPALAAAGRELLPSADWRLSHLRRTDAIGEHDLVIASYALGELRDPEIPLQLWRAARVALVLIEPGTPAHGTAMQEIRRRLLEAGAHMVAPCPGQEQCPLPPHDWCHFAVRVERSSLHRRLKGGSLGYEDEKFTYLAVARQPALTAAARIIRHPQHQPGLISLEVCFGDRAESVRVSKSDRIRFRAARHASWGDEWQA